MSHYENLKFSFEFNSTLLEEKLGSTNYTLKDVLCVFVENCNDFVDQLGNGEIQKITFIEIGQGKGFCSRIFRISIEFGDCGGKNEKYTFIVKAPTDEQFSSLLLDGDKLDAEQSRDLVVQLHNCECNAYEFLKTLENVPTPKVYYFENANDQRLGLIVLEDAGKSAKSLDVYDSANREQCKEFVRVIANFQAQLNFMEDQSWRHKFLNNYQATDFVESVLKGIIRPALKHEDKELADWVRRYFDADLKALAKFAIEDFTDREDVFTLCHTDMWSNNLFIKLDSNGEFTNEISSIIDWQTTRIGNPLYDCCCFILLCSDAETRQKSEEEFVNLYYDELCKHYSKYGTKPAFTREQAHEFYKIAFAQLVVPLIITIAIHALPNDSQSNEKRKKAEKLVKRLKIAFEDVKSIWNKYDLSEKCKLKD